MFQTQNWDTNNTPNVLSHNRCLMKSSVELATGRSPKMNLFNYDKRQLVREAIRLLSQGKKEDAKAKLLILYLDSVGSSEVPPTMPIHMDDLNAEGVSLDEFKRLCAELPPLMNPFRDEVATDVGYSYCTIDRKLVELVFELEKALYAGKEIEALRIDDQCGMPSSPVDRKSVRVGK